MPTPKPFSRYQTGALFGAPEDIAMHYEPHVHARTTDPETSGIAAESLAQLAALHMARVFAALEQHGPGTSYDLARWSGLTHAQTWRRVSDLLARGMIEPSGDTKKGDTGRPCRVYRIAEHKAAA